MKEIPLTQGKIAKISDHRFDYLNQWKWYAIRLRDKWYAARKVNRRPIFMHRVITAAPEGLDVDHRDGDGLNNTDENLRPCTQSQNQQNRPAQKNSTTGFKGVTPRGRRFAAKIQYLRKSFFLGHFETAAEAARAYDVKAKELFGEFAWTNF